MAIQERDLQIRNRLDNKERVWQIRNIFGKIERSWTIRKGIGNKEEVTNFERDLLTWTGIVN